jgi:hypothetical protein
MHAAESRPHPPVPTGLPCVAGIRTDRTPASQHADGPGAAERVIPEVLPGADEQSLGRRRPSAASDRSKSDRFMQQIFRLVGRSSLAPGWHWRPASPASCGYTSSRS